MRLPSVFTLLGQSVRPPIYSVVYFFSLFRGIVARSRVIQIQPSIDISRSITRESARFSLETAFVSLVATSNNNKKKLSEQRWTLAF